MPGKAQKTPVPKAAPKSAKPARQAIKGSFPEEAHAYLAAIVDSADDAIVSKNLDGIITTWNVSAERILGYSAEEIIGKSVLTIIPPEKSDEEDMILGKVRRGERIQHFETERLRKDGSKVEVSITVSPVRNAEGRIIGASKILRDITERRRTEAALRAASQMRNTVERLQLLSDTARNLLDIENPIELLDRVFDRLAMAFGVDFYFHFDVDPVGALRLRACRGTSPEIAQKIERLEFGGGACGSVASRLKPTIITDVQETGDGPMIELIRVQGITAYASHPLMANGRLYGTLSYGSLGETSFSPELLETIGAVSDMTATAAARRQAELFLAARIRQQRAVANLGLLALREDDLNQLLDRATATVARTLEVDLCKVLELLPSGKELILRSGVGWKKGLVGRGTVGAGSDSQAGYTLSSSTPVIVEDLRTEKRFNGPPLLHEHGVISGLSCIIVGENKQPWGVLGAHVKSRRRFTEDDVAFLQAVANVLAGSIQRKRAEQQFRLAVEAAPNGMVMVDEKGAIKMVNSQMEGMFGYAREEIVGQPIEMLLSEDQPADASLLKGFFLSPAAHGEQRREFSARRKDGSEFPVEVDVNPAETPEGVIVMAAVVDISQRKQMEAELAEAHARLGHHARDLEARVAERTAHLQQTIAELEGVSYSLTHDMRAPLRTIRSFSQIVLTDAGQKLEQEERDLLEKVIVSAGRLDRLIQEVLIYSRVSRDSIALQTVDVEALVRQAIDERPEFQPPQAEIEIQTPLDPVRGHDVYLTQCITNLLDNAVKFVPPGAKSRVRVWSEAREGDVRLWFEDNGLGIPTEARERVFGIFQRIHDEKAYPGTGIGLAIVHRAIERMGGSVGVEAAPGEGSRFWLQLPRGDGG